MNRLLCGVLLFALAGGADAAELPEGWFEDWESAAAQAGEQEKPMFAVFSAAWCGPCQSMVKNIYPQQQVRAELGDWIPVYIDVDKHPQVAAKYRVNQLPTLIYMNPDATEINRTVGAVTTARKMVELLESKGEDQFAGGATSLAAQSKIHQLSTQLRSDPRNLELRKKRFDLILDQALYQVSRANLVLAQTDHRYILAADPESRQTREEDQSFLRILSSIERRPELKVAYLENFEQQFPDSKRLKSIWVVSAKESMKKARYKTSAANMKKYLARFPDGEFADEFNLLLPQIEDFIELSKGVPFQ